MNPFRALLTACVFIPAVALAAPTEVLPLSGMGAKDEAPVYWDFRLDSGRGSGEWRPIAVPSQWEQQGFGSYYYGTQGRGKPDDDPIIPRETGTYRRSFEIPASWQGREIFIVFEAAMTDTTVIINGKQAGPTHQGGFYRFSHDISKLVKPGVNQVQVIVAKESANTSVNRAERRGDYWTFGGIYRPVWLEARPAHHIEWTAIDARADGGIRVRVHFNAPLPRRARVLAQLIDPRGTGIGWLAGGEADHRQELTLEGSLQSPALWTAETPNLYSLKFTLSQGKQPLHELTQRFGFRTIEVRANDGVYLNGRKIVLKGINRHSFRPATGRMLTREDNYADARLIKAANMNAVRMSHYPPDPAFLDAADELGLYVLDELAGWQGSYDAPTGARLIGQMIRRDVNHPSILFWDNGNEGGWNTDNDGEFARWDPQRRKVLHPWATHDDINTDHYEKYASTVKLSAGPQIFMPTEFLHGLYDGGIGAGFEDYWKVMGSSPTVAGGFFWAFADECVRRTDQANRIDCMGNSAPDGIVGPNHEKEGSFFTVRQIWSPVQVSQLRLAPDGALRMRLRNDYDFADLGGIRFDWSIRRLPDPGADSVHVPDQGQAQGPSLAPRQEMEWAIADVGASVQPGDVIHLSARDAQGSEIRAWTLVTAPAPCCDEAARAKITRQGMTVNAGDYALTFAQDGTLTHLRRGDLDVALTGPTLMAWLRDGRGFKPLDAMQRGPAKVTLAPRERNVIARVEFATGGLHSLTWRIAGDELRLAYELDYTGDVDIYGIRFESQPVRGKRWIGEGPYRIWKNRVAGTGFGLYEASYSNPVPGQTFDYPEFPGFFGAWRWLEMYPEAPLSRVVFRNVSGIPYFGLHRPEAGKQPVIDLPDLGWSFLHAIPPIGSKFDLAETLGPQSQRTVVRGTQRGEIALRLLPLH
jgi:hypothetical protein